jgi:hypothetical protein
MSDSQAYCAGSIPVTHSMCEKRCHTYESGVISHLTLKWRLKDHGGRSRYLVRGWLHS